MTIRAAGWAASYYDPSGGEQADSTVFQVLKSVDGVVEVPAQPWTGDGVVVLRAALHGSLKVDEACWGRRPCALAHALGIGDSSAKERIVIQNDAPAATPQP